MMRPETKLVFDRACDALGLEPERREKGWRQISDLGLSPDDPTAIFLAVSGVLDRATETLPAALAAMPAKVEEAAKRAVGPVAAAATKQVQAAQAQATADLGPALASAALQAFDKEARARRRGESYFGALFALLLAVLVGWGGYYAGTIQAGNVRAKSEALALRSDFDTLWKLAQGNADLATSIATYCGSGSGRVVVTADGLRNCAVSLWIDGKGQIIPATTNRGYPLASLWAAGSSWLNAFRPTTIALGAFALGLLLPVTVRWVRKGRQERRYA